MKTKLINKVLGYLKIISVVVFVLAGIITLINRDFSTNPKLVTTLGFLFGFFLMLVFCFYLTQSGWTQITEKRINYKFLFWTGFVIGIIIIVIGLLSVIESGIMNLSRIHAVVLVIFTFLINDVTRIIFKNKKYQ